MEMGRVDEEVGAEGREEGIKGKEVGKWLFR